MPGSDLVQARNHGLQVMFRRRFPAASSDKGYKKHREHGGCGGVNSGLLPGYTTNNNQNKECLYGGSQSVVPGCT